MSTPICGEPSSDITEANAETPYAGEKKLLPSVITDTTDRDSTTQFLTTTKLDSILSELERAGTVPVLTPSNDTRTAARRRADYKTAADQLLINAKTEYCYYHNRYIKCLELLFAALGEANTGGQSSQLGTLIESRLEKIKRINRKLNDLLQIINRITKKMLESTSSLEASVTRFNTEMGTIKDKLEKQNTIIQSNEAKMRLQKDMVAYTEEKARHSDNLLKMYSFLNIVALGLLVYVYKAAGDN